MSYARPSSLLLLLTAGACFNPDPNTPLDTEGSSTDAPDPSTTTTPDPTTTGVDPGTTTDTPPETTSGMVDSSTGPGEESTTEPGEPEVEVSIEGMVLRPGARWDLTEQVVVGETGTGVEVLVENVGTADLQLGGVVVYPPGDAHFVVDQASLAVSLAPGESSTFIVASSPTNGGIHEVAMALGSDDADEGTFDLTFGAHSAPNRFHDLQPMNAPTPRFNAAMVYVGDGRLVLFGGRDNANVRLDDTWMFDVELGDWMQLSPASSPPARDAHAMAYVGDDRVILFGGSNQQGQNPGLDDTWQYDVAMDQWSPLPTPVTPTSRYQHTMASAPGGALLFGGRSGGNFLSDVWRFNAMANTWINQGPPGGPPTGLHAGAMDFNGDDTMVIYGGFEGTNPMDVTYRYTLSTNSWSPGTPAGGPGNRGALAGQFLTNGQMVVYSGKEATCCNDPDPGTFGYDPMTDTWMVLSPPGEPTPRFNYAMAAVDGTNKAIIFGGQFLNGGAGSATAETWEYVGTVPMP